MIKNTCGEGDFRRRFWTWARRAEYLARPIPLSVLTAFLIAGCTATPVSNQPGGAACAQPGHWIEPAAGKHLAPETALKSLSRRRVVLLGETHDHKEDHLWQAQMLAALHAYRPNTVIAFEMFTRSEQPVLDEWVSGALSEKAFLEGARWKEVWGYASGFYMPMFQFARQNRLPMIAANVDRRLIRRVSHDGWNSIPANERHGIGTPAPASDAYRRYLARVYGEKIKQRSPRRRPPKDKHPAAKSKPGEAAPTIKAILEKPAFQNFVDAQLTWDRAMAEAIATALQKNPDALILGIIGRGHAEFGYGVPDQLRQLGITDTAVALPIAVSDCPELPRNIADAVFLVADPGPEPSAKPKPLLGVQIEKSDKGVRIVRVIKNSVAERAELAKGDVIAAAAGIEVRQNKDLIAIIQRQAPGTWLPLRVLRGELTLDIVAKFPATFGTMK